MDESKPVPKPRARSTVSSGDQQQMSESPCSQERENDGKQGDSMTNGPPLAPRQAWGTSNTRTREGVDQMYTDNANSSEEEFVVEDEEHDSDEYQDSSDRVLVERSVPSRYHPEDPLKGITSQSHVPSGTSLPSYMAGRTPSNTAVIPGYKPTRSPSSTSEEGTILRREVTDLKNKKKFLEFQIQKLEVELRDKKVHVEEKESALELRERNLLEREQTMVMERGNIDIKLKKLAHKEKELEAMEDNLIVRKKTLEEREFLLSDMPQESSHNSREKERELNEWEDRLKKKEKHLTEWTKELHEEAEKIRLKKLKMDQEFEDKLAALNLMEQETSELTTIPISETAVSDPHASEDLELAKSIQEKLWQVCVCVCVCACACVCVCVCVCICVCVCVCVHACRHACMHMCVSACMRMCMMHGKALLLLIDLDSDSTRKLVG